MDQIKKNLKERGWFFWDWRRISTSVFKDENWIVIWVAPYHESTLPHFIDDLKTSTAAAKK
jgi:hypothetical protein